MKSTLHHSIEGWFDFEEVYDLAISRGNDGDTFVEVGTWLGKSASYLAAGILESEKDIKLYCVDTWKGADNEASQKEYIDSLGGADKFYDKFLSNISPVSVCVYPLRMESLNAAKTFNNDICSFVFIDANHCYESVKSDIRAWLPKVKIGGIIAGHDYGYGDVERAVNEIFPQAQKYKNCWVVFL